MTRTKVGSPHSKGGKVKIWSVQVESGLITLSHGYDGGQITTHTKTLTKGKNIGKTNETTPEQQAVLEAKSKVKKQKDKGYTERKSQVSTTYSPMLAKTYVPGKTTLPSWVYVVT